MIDFPVPSKRGQRFMAPDGEYMWYGGTWTYAEGKPPLPRNTIAWFDASEPASFYVALGGDIVTWYDRMNNFTLYRGGTAGGAKWGTTTRNGLPVASFDGTAYMFSALDVGPQPDASQCAIVGVAQTRTGTQKTWCGFGELSTGLQLTHAGEPGSSTGWGLLVSYVEWWVPGPQANNEYHVQTVTVSSKYASLRKNGVHVATKTIAPITAKNQIQMAGDASKKTVCDICEVFYISGAWSQQEIEDLEGYLRIKWGI